MKNYVDVICVCHTNGQMKPLYILWGDGSKYPIDRITQIIPAASVKSGGCGLRYTCKIGRSMRYLFYEEGKWFIERVAGYN